MNEIERVDFRELLQPKLRRVVKPLLDGQPTVHDVVLGHDCDAAA